MVALQKYDLTIYGATGFTGRLAAKYVSTQYGSSIRWAIAGRSEAKLLELQATLGGVPGVVVADGDDDAALAALVGGTKAVAALAGPFARYGSKLVGACVAGGVGYCDITGEVAWVREMVAKHDDDAKVTGAQIVHLCGHDSVPWDLSTLMLANKLKESGESLSRVDFYDKLVGAPSGGTIETMMGIIADPNSGRGTHAKALGFDPLLKKSDGASAFETKDDSIGSFSTAGEHPRSLFVMAKVNGCAVKRSNALLGYGTKVTYSEGMQHASALGALAAFAQMALGLLLLVFPPTRLLLRKFVLPAPGQGPSEEKMAKGFLHITGVAKGDKGTIVKSLIKFHVDAGYKDTARMVVESALALALEPERIKSGGGVFTPACCQGEVLLERLCKTGSDFAYL
ncbi:hypothetical protein M885DRAFT_482456 [Pelagophyceae sp. CCMP2097]|nr:hypothetical protein M885DRAFT_482456 [Pelagophyceae sp. CCMP2097]